jgi:hypothetical protein
LNVIELAPHLHPTRDLYAANFHVSTMETIKKNCVDDNSRCLDRVIRYGRVTLVPCRCLCDHSDMIRHHIGKKSLLRPTSIVGEMASITAVINARVVIAIVC